MIDKRRNRNRVIIIIVFILLVVGMIYLLLPSRGKITVINEDLKTVVFKHDSNWKLKQKDDNLILLKNVGGSQLKIQITTINNDYRYSSIDELVDELNYNIQDQNKSYKLISKKKGTVTANMYNSYKFLYENNDEQAMVVVYKIGDKLISYIYEASNDYFDILLDSVHSIINSLSIKDESYELGDSVKLNIEDISYASNSDLDNLLTDTNIYKIASNNYLVEYEIPSIFKVTSMVSSSNGYYEYKKDYQNKINMTFYITGNSNIYKYFDTDRLNIYSKCSYYRDNESGDYSNYKEVVSKYDSKYDSYIYRCSYDYKPSYSETTTKGEKIYLLFAISNNQTLVIEIESNNIPVTKKMLDMIKIKSVTNYSSYILNIKDGNNLVGELKEFTDYNYNKIRTVKLLIPDKYKEVEGLSDNIYEHRSYRLNYDETYDLYDYEINYQLDSSVAAYDEKTMKSRIDSINSIYVKSTYGKAQNLTFTKKITLNGKEFYMYDGGYTTRSGVLLEKSRKDYYKYMKVLFYIVSDKSAVEITINGNDKKITDSILKEVTNFTINEESV